MNNITEILDAQTSIVCRLCTSGIVRTVLHNFIHETVSS